MRLRFWTRAPAASAPTPAPTPEPAPAMAPDPDPEPASHQAIGLRTMPPDDGQFAVAVRDLLARVPTDELGRTLHLEERVYRLLLTLRERYPAVWARERTSEDGSSVWEVWREAATPEPSLVASSQRR